MLMHQTQCFYRACLSSSAVILFLWGAAADQYYRHFFLLLVPVKAAERTVTRKSCRTVELLMFPHWDARQLWSSVVSIALLGGADRRSIKHLISMTSGTCMDETRPTISPGRWIIMLIPIHSIHAVFPVLLKHTVMRLMSTLNASVSAAQK